MVLLLKLYTILAIKLKTDANGFGDCGPNNGCAGSADAQWGPYKYAAGAETKFDLNGYSTSLQVGSSTDLGVLAVKGGANFHGGIRRQGFHHIDATPALVGAGASVEIGGVGIGAGIGVGWGVNAGLDKEKENLGLSVVTPAGTFGAHFGCETKLCFYFCLNFTFC